jgi:hypothetical protein
MKKIVIFTALFALVLGGTALAADWNFYGSSRMALFSNTYSKDIAAGGAVATGTYANPLSGTNDWTTTTYGQQGNARIGSKVSAGDISGQFEYGLGSGPAASAAHTRLLYGTWNFGSGKMNVGRMWTATYFGLSNQVYDGDNGLAMFGGQWSRYDQIQFDFGGFKIAAVAPSTALYTVGTGNTFTRVGTKVLLPKIEAAYNGAFGPVNLHVSGGWNSVEAVDAANNGKTITSMLGQAMVKYSGGPFMVGGSFTYGINQGNYSPAYGPAGVATAVLMNNEVKDTTSMGFNIVAGFTINDMFGIEAGYGYVVNSYDSAVSSNDDPAMSYYVQVPITLADGVFIVPEVGKMDFDENAAKVKEGDVTYFGAKFQINF